MSEPCRLCGSEPEVVAYYDFYRFNCPTEGCGEHLDNGKVVNGIGVWYGSIAEARDAWNQRQRREKTPSATQTAEPEPEPAREGDEPQIGEIAWHREVLDGHHPSDCPYCGCERVVVGDYEPCLDDEWDYHIEHKNPKEAIGRKCFEMYAAFKTPEDAVRGADMRAPEWAIPINDDTMRVLSDVCGEKPKRQLRAEAVERLRKVGMEYDVPWYIALFGIEEGDPEWDGISDAEMQRRLIDLLTDDAPEQPVDSGEADSREKLEADVRGIRWGHAFHRYDAQKCYLDERGLDVREDIVTTNYDGHVLATVIMHLLDRQAAITKNECREEHRKRLGELHDLLDEAAHEREELARRVEYNGELVEKVKRERNRLQYENDALKKRISQSAACETAETGETDAAKEHMRDFDADSRERLEADVARHYAYTTSTLMWPASANAKTDWIQASRGEVLKWLDRQAAITERELCARCSPYATAKDYLDTIDELTAERDELQSIIDRMPKTEAECEACQDAHDRLMFNAKVHQDELRDELKHKQLVIDRQRDSFAKMEREYRELQDVCGELERTIENMRGD